MIKLKDIKRVLMVYAHPDDETLAAGATMSKLQRMGVDIHVAIPATGIHSRRQSVSQKERDAQLIKLRADCHKAMSVFGVPAKKLYLGDFPDNEMDTRSLLEIIHWVEHLIKTIKPDVIFTHHRYCTNIDHQYCHEAVMVATRPSEHSHIAVIAGEIPSSTGYLRPAQWEPNFYVDVSSQDLQKKIRAMENFKSEARRDPHPRSKEVLKALAKVRGSEAGFYFAESFMIQRVFA